MQGKRKAPSAPNQPPLAPTIVVQQRAFRLFRLDFWGMGNDNAE